MMKHALNLKSISSLTIAALSLFLLSLASCSSAPKRPAEIFSVRNMAETQLEQANREADRGNYDAALELLESVRWQGVSVDDPVLQIRANLALGNALFYLGRTDEADAAWKAALAEANAEGQDEFAALTGIYMARSRLLSAEQGSGGVSKSLAEEVLRTVNDESGRIKSNKQYSALGWTVAALAQKELGAYADAEGSVKKALDVHSKGNYLELAAYDWYLIASIRSVAGNYPGAREALREALLYDRRAENSHGLGMDWRALGDIHVRMNDPAAAKAAYLRSADIFRSIQLIDEAEKSEARIKEL